jgi:hypothetical protein
MVSFRRCFLAFAVLALLVGVASAQIGTSQGVQSSSAILSCALNSQANQLRSEGATELVADLIITCTGGGAAAAIAGPTSVVNTGTVTVNLTVPVTSRILSTATGASEALLLIDEPGNPQYTTGGVSGVNAGAFLGQNGVSAASAPGTTYGVGINPVTGGTAVEACPTAYITPGTNICTYTGVTGNVQGPPNVFQGIVPANGFQVVFPAVPILAPGTAGLQRVFRITNIRVDANALASAPISSLTGVTAFVSITSTALTLSPTQVSVGFASPGLSSTSTVRGPANSGALSATSTTGNAGSLGYLQCVSVPSTVPAGTTPQGGAILRFTPSFAGAFKTRTLAQLGYNGLTIPTTLAQNLPGTTSINYATYSESGLVFTGFSGTSSTGLTVQAGLADFGTRLKAEFVNIPAGVNVFVTTSNIVSAAGTSAIISPGLSNVAAYTFANFAGGAIQTNIPLAFSVLNETVPDGANLIQPPYTATSSSTGSGNIPIVAVTLSNGAGEAVWEVVQEPASNTTPLDFGVFFQYTTSAGTTFSTLPGQVGLSYAPTPPGGLIPGPLAASSLTTATTGPIPRFADTSLQHEFSLIQLGACQTLLLFPYVTNQAGFETGLAIANTSSDALNTVAQAGTCTFSFYGITVNEGGTPKTNTQANVVSPVVPSGGSFVDTLSHTIGATNSFSGYMFASCNFQYAHGFAFISDASATNLAEGYLALVVTNGGSSALRGNGTILVGGESLTH